MKKPFKHYLEIPIFRLGCWFVVVNTKEDAQQWFEKTFKESIDLPEKGDAHAVLAHPSIIFLFDWSPTPEQLSNLVHECVHIANHFIDFTDIKEEKGCDEVQAYLVGYLVEGFLKAVKKKV